MTKYKSVARFFVQTKNPPDWWVLYLEVSSGFEPLWTVLQTGA